jgi:glycosyltransferase involved in cell wall biosynthesis
MQLNALIIASSAFRTSWHPDGGIFQYDLARALTSCGLQSGILSVNKLPVRMMFQKLDYLPFEIIDGIPVFRRYLRHIFSHRLDKKLFLGRVYAHYAEILFNEYCFKFGRPAIIHAHCFKYGGVIASVLSKKYNIPFIVTEHSSAFLATEIPDETSAACRNLIKEASAVVAVSDVLAVAMAKKINIDLSEITVIPNLLAPEFSKGVVETNIKPQLNFVFLTVGDLIEIKNHALLLSAFREVVGYFPAELRIVGTGPLEANLKEFASNSGIADKVKFLGQLTREEVLLQMSEADCFLLPSKFETFGVVVIEALSQGLPIIITESLGIASLLTEKDGKFVAVNDQKSLVIAMIEVRNEVNRFIKSEISERCLSRFSPTRVAGLYKELYRRITG